MTQVQKQASVIQSPAIYRVRSKATRQVMYLVQSDSQAHTWYEVRWNGSSLLWECNCPSRKPCKHERAVHEVLKIRRLAVAAAMGVPAVETVKEWQRDEDRRLANLETSQKGCLNGSSQGFRLLK